MSPDRVPALVLGTAQWGLDYGVTNTAGRLSDDAVQGILALVPRVGIHLLDTAPAYGDAEARIGALAPGVPVQTKVSGVDDVRASLTRSTDLLGGRPERVIVHDWPALTGAQQALTAATLEALRDEGHVRLVGISGYESSDLATGLAAFDRLDIAQVPVSLLDQRLAGSPEVAALRARGGRLQARSVYLQGVALSSPGETPLADHPDVARLRETCAAAEVEVAAACRAFVRSLGWVDEIVVGVTSADELTEWAADDPVEGIVWEACASDDPDLIDPRRWPPAGRG